MCVCLYYTHCDVPPPRSEPASEARELVLAVRGREERKGRPPNPPAAVDREEVELEKWEVSRYEETGCWCLEPPRKLLLAVEAVLGAPAVNLGLCVYGETLFEKGQSVSR